ncbi:MAG: ribonuclease P protein component [Rubrivivax sp.]
MIGRLVQSADFQRLLATPSRSRSAHFAVHHVATGPAATAWQLAHSPSTDLSTERVDVSASPVDSSPPGHWLGSVVPKRHAKRSVTRNLLRRQIRAAMAERLDALPAGLWLVRLRQPFDRQRFVSAASPALRREARTELRQLFERAAARRPG